MNKKAMSSMVYFMIGVMFFVLGMALAPSIFGTTNEARGDLHCSWTNITNQDKAVCTQLDAMSPLWVGVLFGISGLILTRIIT